MRNFPRQNVLACYECNNRRSKEFTAALSLEEKWKRAKIWVRMTRESGALPGETEG